MCELIEHSKHLIYIENQFFISGFAGNPKIGNRVNDSLFRRVVRAHEDGTTFHIYVLMPLLPDLGGKLQPDGDSGAMLNVMNLQYRSISRGEDSLFGRLQAAGIEPRRQAAPRFDDAENGGDVRRQE